MINVSIKRDQVTRAVRGIQITGHAAYDDYGKDIVCAAVSSVSINILNAVEAIIGVRLNVSQDDGKLVCDVPVIDGRTTDGQVQLLMQTLVFSLRSIASEYPNYVSVKETEGSDCQC